MDFQFIGHKKTNDSFLNKIKQISQSHLDILHNLKTLQIFNTITPINKKIALDEKQKSVKMKISSTGNKNFIINFPNIFGNGEFINLNYKSVKDCNLEIGAPAVFNNHLCHNKLSLDIASKMYNDKNVESRRIEVSSKVNSKILKVGIESIHKLIIAYNQADFTLFGCNCKYKVGATRNVTSIPFLKLLVARSSNFSYKSIFADFNLSLGRLFGQTNLTEKFFLGSKIRGYKDMSVTPISQNKKCGGNSFIELKNRIGFCIKNIELFIFGDVGVCSLKGLRECGDLLYKFEDNNCIGKSIGCGISLKNKPGVSFIYSIPLTQNSETEKYSFGLDLEF